MQQKCLNYWAEIKLLVFQGRCFEKHQSQTNSTIQNGLPALTCMHTLLKAGCACMCARKVLRTNTKVIGCHSLLWISEKRGEGSLTSRPKCRTLSSRGEPFERQVRVPIIGDPDHNPMSKGLTVSMLKGICHYWFCTDISLKHRLVTS